MNHHLYRRIGKIEGKEGKRVSADELITGDGVIERELDFFDMREKENCQTERPEGEREDMTGDRKGRRN